MRWYWNHSADELWRQLDPALWDFTYNPWVVLQPISRERLRRVLSDASFRDRVDELLQAGRREAEEPAWFQLKYPEAPLTSVAYFSMEFMLSEALPIYSGGLGNVAGDQLKAASDLGVPVMGVGLLYQQGYFRQVIDRDGGSRRFSRTTTRGNCRSRRCASRMGNGCGWSCRCPAIRSGCARGRCRWAV